MNNSAGSAAPFEVGDRVAPDRLFGWSYVGLRGLADQPDASRRYTKGVWVLQLRAYANKSRPARILSLRTESEDKQWWNERPVVARNHSR